MNLDPLLTLIRKHEGGPGLKGYGQIFWGARGVSKNTDVSKLTLQQVKDFQKAMKRGGSKSTACGGYQFIQSTFNETVSAMGLPLSLVWDPELQDRMAIHLLNKRGLQSYLAGKITRETFANNLAAEWASLPMVSGPKKGRSKYAGDGLNNAHHTIASVLAAIDAIQ